VIDVEGEAARLLAFARRSRVPGVGYGWMTADGSLDDGQGVHTWITTRMTHVFGLAAMQGMSDNAEFAAAGVEALLRGPLRDSEFGGWFGSVDTAGEPVADHKLAYDHAFVVLAASTGVAADIPQADRLLDEAMTVFERWFLDDLGRVIDGYPRDLGVADAYRGANSSMHSVEALLALGDVRGDHWHRCALTIAEHLIGQVTNEFSNRLPEHFDAAWNALPEYNTDHRADPFRPYGVTPGHLLEWSRLLLQLEASLDDPPGWLVVKARALFAAAVDIGWSVDGHPGFVYTTDWQDRAVVRNRMHWVHAEAVACAAALAARTGESMYADWTKTWWEFIEANFLEPQSGRPENWQHELDAQNQPAAQTWKGRPDVYHGYQALLLRQYPEGRSVADRLLG